MVVDLDVTLMELKLKVVFNFVCLHDFTMI